MANKKTEVVIADSQGLVLEGLKSILINIPQIGNVQMVFTGEDLVRLLKNRTFDIYILDVELSGMNGFDVIKKIRARDKKAHIIINTIHEEIWIINRLINNDVDSIVSKKSDTKHLKNAIQAVLESKPYFCPRIEYIRNELRRESGSKLLNQNVPTSRELEVLRAISKGLNTGEISDKLCISENTVETHRKNLMLKFGAKNSTDLVLKALARGYLTISI